MKKKQYLCTMKEEFKKYLESETKRNEQDIHMREVTFKIGIFMIILCLGLAAFGMYMALS